MAQGIIISLIVIGVFLLLMEIFVIPGFGVSGILGMAALITGIFLVTDTFLEGMIYTVIVLVVLAFIAYLSFRSPRTRRLWKKFSLTTRQTLNDGYVGPKVEYETYLGRVGTALTQLRPAGTADFDGEYLDVVTEGGFISAKTKVKIVAVEGTRIVVREERDGEEKTL